ncbi:MAG: type sorting protein [Mucilaginibacter sp.]|nr:type sorting protein [Mucilaginibacter sp.]
MFNKIAVSIKVNKLYAVFCMSLLLLLLGYKGYSQSLGDPIVNITFGSGTSPRSGSLPADSGSTTYNYSTGSPNDGYYTIANTTMGMNSGWWTTTDHTGNAGGYMMVVNGSYEPGIFYTRTIKSLCGNTTYQFAAWIKNLLNYDGILPNVTFSIETTDGTVLGSGNTGNIPTGNTWIQYPFTFSTPANTESIVIKMINNAPGGKGNDIAIDDITFRPYGAKIAVAFDQSTTLNSFCAGYAQNLTINATTALPAGYAQKIQLLVNGVWTDQSTGGTASSITVPSPIIAGTYYYRIVTSLANNINSSQCVVASNQLTLTVNPMPTAAFSVPDTTCSGGTAVFTDQSAVVGGIITGWQWNFGDGQAVAGQNTSSLKNPSHTYTKAAVYPVTLTVTSNNGCSATATKNVTINGSVPVAAFTVLNSTELCSNREVFFTNQSTVDFGNITKIQMYYDYGNQPTVVETDNNPYYNKLYRHTYIKFATPAAKNYQVRMLAYSGVTCVAEIDKTVTLLATPQLIFTSPASVCINAGTLQLIAKETNGIAGSGIYSGTGVSSSGLFNPATAGVGTFAVSYIYTANNACADTISQNITVNELPIANAGPNITVLEGGSATLKAIASGDSLVYSWYPATYLSNSTVLHPVSTPGTDIVYMLTVTNTKGCSASSQVTVSVLKSPIIPNTFTPNGDGINDTWAIKYLESYSNATVEVFNRYGQKVYYSIGYPIPWDGRYNSADLPAGVYYYVINPMHGRKVLSGWVSIIR